VRTNKGELAVLNFLRTGIARTVKKFKTNVDTLTRCQNFKNCFEKNHIQWVSYFVKTKPSGYHKIMIPPNTRLNGWTP